MLKRLLFLCFAFWCASKAYAQEDIYLNAGKSVEKSAALKKEFRLYANKKRHFITGWRLSYQQILPSTTENSSAFKLRGNPAGSAYLRTALQMKDGVMPVIDFGIVQKRTGFDYSFNGSGTGADTAVESNIEIWYFSMPVSVQIDMLANTERTFRVYAFGGADFNWVMRATRLSRIPILDPSFSYYANVTDRVRSFEFSTSIGIGSSVMLNQFAGIYAEARYAYALTNFNNGIYRYSSGRSIQITNDMIQVSGGLMFKF
jgi:hypothetical protein